MQNIFFQLKPKLAFKTEFDYRQFNSRDIKLNWHKIALLHDEQIFNDAFYYQLIKEKNATQNENDSKINPNKQFQDYIYSYQEIFSRDQDAYNFARQTPTYVLLFYTEDGIYQGHIYVWFIDNMCFAIGIRKRFQPFGLSESAPISAGKSFAEIVINKLISITLERKCKLLAIPSPRPVMRRKLEQMGFELTFDLAEFHEGTIAENLESDYYLPINKM